MWENPFETAFALVIVGAVLTSFLVVCFWKFHEILALIPPISLMGVVVFPLSVFSLLVFYKPTYRHVCYERQLKINGSRVLNHRRERWVNPKNIERLMLKEVCYKGETFVVAKIIFKPFGPKFLGSAPSLRFGISGQKGVNSFRSWASAQHIPITEEV
jgi:hypothetical protein